jgi:hypothetical protein
MKPDNKQEEKRLVLFVAIVILILLGATFLTGCVTEKKRAKICASCPSTNTVKTTKKDSVSASDSSFYNPGQSGGDVSFNFSSEQDTGRSECDSIKKAFQYLKDHPIIKKVNGITTTIKSDGKSITANCKYDSLLNIIKKYREKEFVEIDSAKQDKIVTNECPETWWQVLYRYGFWLQGIFIALYFGIKGFRFIAELSKKFP